MGIFIETELLAVLGGNLTAGYVRLGPILGMVAPGTMRDELLNLLGVPDNDMIGEVGLAHDFEKAKRTIAEFVRHENITVYLQTMVADAIMDAQHLKGVILASKEGQFALIGKTIVDATGDGDVASFAGADYEKGRVDGLMQPVTLEFTISDVDETQAIACIGDVDTVQLNGEKFLDFCKRCSQEGLLPTNLAAVRLHRTTVPGERQVNTTQVNGIDSTVVHDLFPAELALRQQIDLLMDFFHQNLPGYENCQLKASGSTLGVRESRRISGLYQMTAEDLVNGRRFTDVIVHKADFIVDIHNPNGPGQADDQIQHVRPYDLPYRSFVPIRIDNLLMAGRCISGSHRAHASYRVMSICMAMGQAIGIAAALCARTDCSPRDLDVSLIQKSLKKKGVNLFDH